MIYIAGDTHGDFSRYITFAARFEPTEDDVMIVLGDAGLNYYGNKKDLRAKRFVEVFLAMIDQSTVDKRTERWLDRLEEQLDYKKWYCGHFHTAKKIDRLQFMFEDIDVLG